MLSAQEFRQKVNELRKQTNTDARATRYHAIIEAFPSHFIHRLYQCTSSDEERLRIISGIAGHVLSNGRRLAEVTTREDVRITSRTHIIVLGVRPSLRCVGDSDDVVKSVVTPMTIIPVSEDRNQWGRNKARG